VEIYCRVSASAMKGDIRKTERDIFHERGSTAVYSAMRGAPAGEAVKSWGVLQEGIYKEGKTKGGEGKERSQV
jgi:hypothetical protein